MSTESRAPITDDEIDTMPRLHDDDITPGWYLVIDKARFGFGGEQPRRVVVGEVRSDDLTIAWSADRGVRPLRWVMRIDPTKMALQTTE